MATTKIMLPMYVPTLAEQTFNSECLISFEKNDVHEKPTLMNTCLELEDISFGIPSSDYKKNA